MQFIKEMIEKDRLWLLLGLSSLSVFLQYYFYQATYVFGGLVIMSFLASVYFNRRLVAYYGFMVIQGAFSIYFTFFMVCVLFFIQFISIDQTCIEMTKNDILLNIFKISNYDVKCFNIGSVILFNSILFIISFSLFNYFINSVLNKRFTDGEIDKSEEEIGNNKLIIKLRFIF